jgi:peptidoglycan/xylan/chitin deacetylase (PgdA/CDA1 family)
LCYHALSRELDDYPFRTTPEAFERQLDWLSSVFDIVSPEAALELWHSGEWRARERPVVTLTFDDGYAEVVDEAAPRLERRGIRAGVFVARNQVARQGATHVSPSTVRDMAGQVTWCVGAHSLSHDALYSLQQNDLEDEIAGSKAWLGDLIGEAPSMFAYPQGKISQRVVDSVRPHFAHAFTTEKRLAGAADRHQIRRLCPSRQEDDLHAFAFWLMAGTWEVDGA